MNELKSFDNALKTLKNTLQYNKYKLLKKNL